MAKQFKKLEKNHINFIKQQHMFFVATAGAEGHVNLSPKGMDSFRVQNPNRAIWLNVTGSGNETAAHVQENARMTIMFCAFEGAPMILRLYGDAKVIHPYDEQWNDLYTLFPETPGARQLFELTIDLVQTSCGMSVPLYDFVDQRQELVNWANKKGDDGIKQYWEEKNQVSLDGKPTNILRAK